MLVHHSHSPRAVDRVHWKLGDKPPNIPAQQFQIGIHRILSCSRGMRKKKKKLIVVREIILNYFITTYYLMIK